MWPFTKRVEVDKYRDYHMNAMILNPDKSVFIARIPLIVKVPETFSYKRGQYEYQFRITNAAINDVEITLENWLS